MENPQKHIIFSVEEKNMSQGCLAILPTKVKSSRKQNYALWVSTQGKQLRTVWVMYVRFDFQIKMHGCKGLRLAQLWNEMVVALMLLLRRTGNTLREV